MRRILTYSVMVQSAQTDRRRIGRFRLDDLVAGDETGGLWRAYDELLGRTVSLRLVPESDPRQEALRVAACTAARVADRHVASVLDVLDHESTLVIVSEWVDGIPLDQFLAKPMDQARSLEVTREVASAIAAIHATGSTHGRLRPASVMIGSSGEVRVRSAGIDAQLWGIAPGTDPAAADIHGVGAILTACLTTRWPGSPKSRLRSAPVIGGRTPTPSQLRADIPEEIDDFVVRAFASVPSKLNVPTNQPFENITEVREALGALKADSGANETFVPAAPRRGRSAVIAKRAFALLGGVAAIAVLIAFGSRLAVSGPSPLADAALSTPTAKPSVQPRTAKLPSQAQSASADESGSVLSPSQSLPASPLPAEQTFPIAAVSSLEQPDGLVTGGSTINAVDTDLSSAWFTKTYSAPVFPRHEGAGLLIDLGEPRPIRVVDLALVGAYTDVEIRTSNDAGTRIANYTKDAALTGAPSRVTVREPTPVTARYVLVVLNGLPLAENGYRGGIANVSVRGG